MKLDNLLNEAATKTQWTQAGATAGSMAGATALGAQQFYSVYASGALFSALNTLAQTGANAGMISIVHGIAGMSLVGLAGGFAGGLALGHIAGKLWSGGKQRSLAKRIAKHIEQIERLLTKMEIKKEAGQLKIKCRQVRQAVRLMNQVIIDTELLLTMIKTDTGKAGKLRDASVNVGDHEKNMIYNTVHTFRDDMKQRLETLGALEANCNLIVKESRNPNPEITIILEENDNEV